MSSQKVIGLNNLDKTIIPDGAVIAIGGVHSHNTPMSLVRQIIRLGIKDLTLIGSISTGLPIDILVGAELVTRVYAPYVGFEMWGLAPRFREAVESGKIQAPDVCEAFPVYSLQAAVNGLLFHPFPLGIHDHSDIPSSSDLYQKVKDPFTGQEVYAVQAIHPDVAILHVQKATTTGNCVHLGSVVTDRLMAEAAKTVIVTCDEMVSEEEIRSNPSQTSIPGFLVDYIIELKYAAHPTSSHGVHGYDTGEIKSYLSAAKDKQTFDDYLASRIDLDEEEYIAKFVTSETLSHRAEMVIKNAFTVEELIGCVFARDIQDGELGICGAVASIPMMALQLAEKLYTPNMKWIAGGSGYVNPRGSLVPSSTDYQMKIGAEAKLSMDEVIPLEMQKIDFFFAGGLQIDKYGNTNLAGIPVDNSWKFRGPGSVGLPFLTRAGRVYLYTLNHSDRILVDKVSYVSGPGHSPTENPFGSGPKLLVTNLCVFEWDEGEQMWRLKSVHPNVTPKQVREKTGFEYLERDSVPTTVLPTEEELRIIREIDPIGYLRGATD